MGFLGNRELRTWNASLGLGFLIERKQKLLKGFKHCGERGGGNCIWENYCGSWDSVLTYFCDVLIHISLPF